MASITGLNGLPKDYVPVTPNDSTDNLPSNLLGFYVVGGGDMVVTNSRGTDRTITVLDNSYVPFVGCVRLKSTGTTASTIFALAG